MSVKAPSADSLLSAAEALLPSVVQIRRRLHRHPEIGLQLPFTQAVVVEELEKLGPERMAELEAGLIPRIRMLENQ